MTYLHLFFFLILMGGGKIQGAEMEIGYSAVDEGDDRIRPAVLVHAGLTESLIMRLQWYGREYGPVREQTMLLSSFYRFAWPSAGPDLKVGLGANLVQEQTRVKTDPDSEDPNLAQDQYNLGMSFHLSYRLPVDWWRMHLSWDSHLYLAGVAGILLSTARKQFLSFSTGIEF